MSPNRVQNPIRIAILSDVHANLPALEAVIADARNRGAEMFWNLGDFLGYGPFVNEVVDLLFDLCAFQVIGNYDLKVLKFPQKQQAWKKRKQEQKYLAFQWAWQHLRAANARRLGSLPRQERLTIDKHNFLLTHGSPAKVNEPIGPDTPNSRLRQLAETARSDLILCGHTHLSFERSLAGVTFVNPGSVGRPEGGDRRSSYAMIDLKEASFAISFYRVEYDIERMITAIRTAGLPEDFSTMLKTGRNLDDVRKERADNNALSSVDDDLIGQVRRYAKECGYEVAHSQQVTRLAEILFDRLAAVHGLGRQERMLLTCGGLLHDIGWLQGQKAHHKTAMEMILQDTTLPFTVRQRTLAALIARYHRKALPQMRHPVYGELPSGDRRIVEKLAGILRVADGLDRSHLSCITDIQAAITPDVIEIQCRASHSATAELRAAEKKSDLLRQVLSKEIRFKS